MNDCGDARFKFISALAEWILTRSPNEPPCMIHAKLCRSCALEMFGKITELSAFYSGDAISIVNEEQPDVKPTKELKH